MRLFVVSGDPISHSLSPIMHNAAFKVLGLDDCTYEPMKVGKGSIHSLISLMREGKIIGANLTHPLKEEVIPFLDNLSSNAKACNSVNTLMLKGSNIIGLTTDGEGCVKALQSKGIKLLGKKIVVIGAGGAAKSIALSILKRGPKRLYVINRTIERAKSLADSIRDYDNIRVKSWKELNDYVDSADIIINCTTVGMKGHEDILPISADVLDEYKVIMDIVYEPIETKLLKMADSAGCMTIDGVEMLVMQAALSFEMWTGLQPPVDIMKSAAKKEIEERLGCVSLSL